MFKFNNFKNILALLTVLITLSLSIDVSAATYTWTGNDGHWDDANNWDLGQVPTDGDDVVIEDGIVTIDNSQNAATINLRGGQLDITDSGVLFLQAIANGYSLNVLKINSDAIFQNAGHVFFFEMNAGPNTTFIDNRGDLVNIEGGVIFMSGSSFLAIDSQGPIHNYGSIVLDGVDEGIYTDSDFFNYGSIEISSEDLSLLTYEHFYNGNSASITVNNIILCEGCQELENYGSITLNADQQVEYGIIIDGEATFHSSGSVAIGGNYAVGLIIGVSQELTNHGEIEIDLTSTFAVDIQNAGVLTNQNGGDITCENYLGDFRSNTGIVNNHGIWTFNTDQTGLDSYVSIHGTFRNEDSGRLYFEHELSLDSESRIKNFGHLFLRSEHKHPKVHGDILNFGSLNDIDGKLSTTINESVIARPVLKQRKISNVLEVNSTSYATILGWYTSATGNISAGTYTSSINTFHPNRIAMALNSVFVEIKINSSNAIERLEVKLLGRGNLISAVDNEKMEVHALMKDFDLAIFPNPTSELLSIELRNSKFVADTDARLLDLQGRELTSIKCTDQCQLKIPENTINGIYLLSVEKEGIPQVSPRIVKVFR